MKDQDRYQLLFGPYTSPQVSVGDEIMDEIRGPVVISTWSKGKIPWPCLRTEGRSAFVLCGDLVRAIEHESSLAIQYWWGVGPATVHRWRKALGIGHCNEGTSRLHRAWKPEKITAQAAARGRLKGISAESRAKMSQTVRERGYYHHNQRVWTPEEEALLGTTSDSAVAKKLGRSLKSVGMWRRKLDIPAFGARQARRLRKDTLPLSATKLTARRMQLRLSQKAVAEQARLNPAHLSQMESGFWHRVKPTTLQRLTYVLQCQISDIIENGDSTHTLNGKNGIHGSHNGSVIAS